MKNIYSSSLLKNGYSLGGFLEKIIPNFYSDLKSYNDSHSEFFMKEAFLESMKSVGISSPNPAVGCVITNANGEELSRGYTQPYRSLHAEKNAWEKILLDPKLIHQTQGGSAYITLEPCAHEGYQPPCLNLFLNSHLKHIWIGLKDPNPKTNGKSIQKLREKGFQVHDGLLRKEISAFNLPFISQMTLNRPLFILKWAQTLDGQLADDDMNSKWISNSFSRIYTHHLRKKYDAIFIGAKTLLFDLPQLTARDCIQYDHENRNPLPIVFDPQGILFSITPEKLENLKTQSFIQKRKWIIITQPDVYKKYASDKKSNIFDSSIQEWATIVSLSLKNFKIEFIDFLMSPLVEQILGRPLQSVMIEGGAKTLAFMIQNYLCDVAHVFISPQLTGGHKNRISLHQSLNNSQSFQLLNQFHLQDDTILELINKEVYSNIFN